MAGLFSKPNYYAVPQQPSFDTMQKVAIPNYKTQFVNQGSNVNYSNPETVYMSPYEDTTQVRAHELQHQIEGLIAKKGQNTYRFNSENTGDVVDTSPTYIINKAWEENANKLGYNGGMAIKLLKDKLSNPKVESYFEKLGFPINSYIRNPSHPGSKLNEILADISSYEIANKTDLTKDPFLSKTVFNDPKLNLLVKSTTGMSGVVIGDSDYTPYSLEAAKAWNKQEPTTFEKIQNIFYKDPFK